MAKGTSFAAKAKGKKKNTQSFVKYIKSVKSEKTGHWRFNEQMIAINEGENLDGALKRLEVELMALDMELPAMEEPASEEMLLKVDASSAETTDETHEVTSEKDKVEDTPAVETEKTDSESEPVETSQEETVEAVQAEDSSDEKAVEEVSVTDPLDIKEEEEETEKTDEDSSEDKTEIDQDENSDRSDTEESKNEVVEEKAKE